MEEPHTFSTAGNKGTNNSTTLNVSSSSPRKPSAVENTPKGKVRAAFSESQMNALVQRFTVQRYLTPGEMKNLAELTGLTYKQVNMMQLNDKHNTRTLVHFSKQLESPSCFLGEDMVSEQEDET